MSVWRHNCCDPCWPRVAVEVCGRRVAPEPVRLVEEFRVAVVCCFCERVTTSGIFVRANPTDCECKGVHAEEDEDG